MKRTKYLTIGLLFIGTIITTGCSKEWTCTCITTTYEQSESGNWWTGTETTTTTSTSNQNYTIKSDDKSGAESSCKAKETSNTECSL